MKIVAVTGCSTGIAHTYMAADRLHAAGKALGHSIKIETQGAMGVENRLTKRDIAEAAVAIFAVDVGVIDPDRFAGIRVVRSSTLDAIENPDALLVSALAARSDCDTGRCRREGGS